MLLNVALCAVVSLVGCLVSLRILTLLARWQLRHEYRRIVGVQYLPTAEVDAGMLKLSQACVADGTMSEETLRRLQGILPRLVKKHGV